VLNVPVVFKEVVLKGEDNMDLWVALFWTGPIGIGVFLAGLGVLFCGIAHARQTEKK
jgi:hypothetical protein